MAKPRKERAPAEPARTVAEASSALQMRAKTLVFVSHDSRDGDIAEAFANLLSDVSGGTLKSFRSSDKKGTAGIEFGSEWYNSIMTKLGDATDVVALLTQRSIDRPWILYEAGVAKGKLNTTVFGIAIGVPLEKVSTGPFGQFQNSGDDEDSLTKLVVQLLARNPDAAPREEAVRMQVRVFREQLPTLLKTAGAPTTVAPAVDESVIAKLFEEVKVMVRDLPANLEVQFQRVGRRGTKRLRRFHPMILEELMFQAGEGHQSQAASWLMVVSLFKDDFPWLYELGLDLYRALRDRNRQEIIQAKKAFQDALDMAAHTRMARDFGPDDDESMMMIRHLPEMLGPLWDRLGSSVPQSRPRKESEK